ncbi:hypothetical protein QOT17_014546 [Balamuthia mandrillaris]
MAWYKEIGDLVSRVKDCEDWNARVGKGWNGRGESTYNARGKVLAESFKRLALLLPQLKEETPVFTWRAGNRKSIVDYVVAWRWTGKVVGDGWQAWTDHRPLVVELKDSADSSSNKKFICSESNTNLYIKSKHCTYIVYSYFSYSLILNAFPIVIQIHK